MYENRLTSVWWVKQNKSDAKLTVFEQKHSASILNILSILIQYRKQLNIEKYVLYEKYKLLFANLSTVSFVSKRLRTDMML